MIFRWKDLKVPSIIALAGDDHIVWDPGCEDRFLVRAQLHVDPLMICWWWLIIMDVLCKLWFQKLSIANVGRVRTQALWNLLHLSGPIHFGEALVRTWATRQGNVADPSAMEDTQLMNMWDAFVKRWWCLFKCWLETENHVHSTFYITVSAIILSLLHHLVLLAIPLQEICPATEKTYGCEEDALADFRCLTYLLSRNLT